MAEWKEMKTLADWEDVLSQSESQPVFVFKHSTTCPISANAWKEFTAYLDSEPREDVSYVMVKVIESRDVSNKIANDLGVKHESPQAIVVKDRKETWNRSHWDITQQSIREALS